MFKYLHFCAAFVVLVLSACGGGGGGGSGGNQGSDSSSDSDSEAEVTVSPSTVSGFSVDGPIAGATITAYKLNPDFSKGATLGTTNSDSLAEYTLTLDISSQNILIEACGGSYTEEASGITVNLECPNPLRVATHYQAGTPLTAMLTPLTNMAVALAEQKVTQGENIGEAIAAANSTFSDIYGFNIVTTIPLDVTNPLNAGIDLNNGLLYGFILAARSELTKQIAEDALLPVHETITSFLLAALEYNDLLADGLYDGVDSSGQIVLGTTDLNQTIYRTLLPQKILEFVNGANNATTIQVSDILAAVQNLSSSEDDLFAGIDPPPLDDAGPVLQAVDSPGIIYNNTITYELLISDLTSVDEVEFVFNGEAPVLAANPTSPALTIDTTAYSDGNYTLRVNASDILGNVTSQDFQLTFNNQGVAINLTSDTITNSPNYTIQGTWSTAGAEIQQFTVNGLDATVNNDGTWSADILLDEGLNTINVVVEDAISNVTSEEYSIGLDTAPPLVEMVNPNNSSPVLVEYVLADSSVYTDLWEEDSSARELYVPAARFSLNGDVSLDNITNNNFPYFQFNAIDDSSAPIYSEAEAIQVSMNYAVAGTPVFTNRIIKAYGMSDPNVVIPIAEEGLVPNWHLIAPNELNTIEVTITDAAGNTTNRSVSFFVRSVPDEPGIVASVSPNHLVSNTSFANRGVLNNASTESMEYQIDNPYAYDIYVRIDGSGYTEVTNAYETGIRENRSRLLEIGQLRVRYKLLNVGAAGTPGGTTNFCTLSGNTSSYISVGSLTRTSGSTISPDSTVVNAYQPTFLDNPSPPGPTSWSTYSLSGGTVIMGNTYDIARLSEPPGLSYGDQPGNWTSGTAGGYSAYVAYYKDGTFNSCGSNFNGLQRRRVFQYENQSGYPRNVFQNESASANNNQTATFTVFNSNGDTIDPENGFYRIPAGDNITVIKTVILPTVTNFDDSELADQGSFNSYDLKQYDRELTYAFDKELNVETVLPVPVEKLDSMTARRSEIASEDATLMLSR